MSTFSRTVMFGKIALLCGTWAIPSSRISAAGRPAIACPANSISPSRGAQQPAHGAQDGRLAGAVRADDARDRALGDLEVERAQDVAAAVARR